MSLALHCATAGSELVTNLFAALSTKWNIIFTYSFNETFTGLPFSPLKTHSLNGRWQRSEVKLDTTPLYAATSSQERRGIARVVRDLTVLPATHAAFIRERYEPCLCLSSRNWFPFYRLRSDGRLSRHSWLVTYLSRSAFARRRRSRCHVTRHAVFTWAARWPAQRRVGVLLLLLVVVVAVCRYNVIDSVLTFLSYLCGKDISFVTEFIYC